jgi:hypothetical protein
MEGEKESIFYLGLYTPKIRIKLLFNIIRNFMVKANSNINNVVENRSKSKVIGEFNVLEFKNSTIEQDFFQMKKEKREVTGMPAVSSSLQATHH